MAFVKWYCPVAIYLVVSASVGEGYQFLNPSCPRTPPEMVSQVASMLPFQQVFLVRLPEEYCHCSEGIETALKSFSSRGVQVTVFTPFGKHITDAGYNCAISEGLQAINTTQHLDDKTIISELTRTLRAILKQSDGRVGVWVTGAFSGVTEAAILGNVLVLQPSSGVVPISAIAPQLRLGAQVLKIERPRGHRSFYSGHVQRALLLPGGNYTFRSVGYWHETHQRLQLHSELLPPLSSLQGATITVVIVKNFVEATRTGPKGNRLKGYLGDVLNSLAASLDFEYHIIEATSFGNVAKNGSYDGVVGYIERMEGDIGLASLSITYHRSHAIDFSAWMLYNPTLFLTRLPRVFHDALILFHIFTWQAYLTIAGFLVITSVCQWLVWVSAVPEDEETICETNRKFYTKRRPPFLSVLVTTLKNIVAQSGLHLPTSTSGRIVFVSTWIVIIMILAVYSGVLTAFLSIPRMDNPPATIADIVSMDWSIVLDKAYGAHDLVKETLTDDYQTLYKRAEERGMIKENEGVRVGYDPNQINDEKVATVMGEIGAYIVMNLEMTSDRRCTLTLGKEAIGKEFSAIAFPKMSLIKPLFDNKLMWMRQMGILQNEFQKYFGVKCFRDSSRTSETKPMKLGQLLGVFYVWTVGMIISSLVFVIEICVAPRM